MSSLVFKNVSIYYQDRKKNIVTAVDDVSFVFEDKKINVLIGFSGCGKSSILNAISGKILFDGEIYLRKMNIKDISVQDRNLSYVSQDFALYPHLTVYDNVAYPLKLLKFSREEIDIRVRELCASMGIDFLLTRKPKYLSLGQQQRVAIARALVKRPDIIMMDEPLSNLDKDTSQEIRELIKEMIKKYNATCIYVSHNITDCLSLADNIFVMDNGKIIGKYSPQEFLDSDNSVISALKVDLPHEEESK